jgi:hypothetical protein
LALAAAIVVYAVAVGERLPEVVAGIGAAGCVLIAIAFVVRRPSVFPVGLAGVGAAYGVCLSLRSGAVDPRAPAVAAALYIAAELGFWSLERAVARSERAVVARRVAAIALGAVLTGLVGSLVLGLTTGVRGGVGLEAAGVAAAALTAAAIAVLASRSSV